MAEDVRSGDAIVREMVALAPADCAPTGDLLEQLHGLTEELLASYRAEGKLVESPMALAMERSVDLAEDEARSALAGRRVMVTGGAGCVGTRLIPLLARLGAREIAIVDFADDPSDTPDAVSETCARRYFQVDIRDVPALDATFALFRPEVVFHLASVREPGRAEAVVREAIETNVLATRNMIEACLRHDVADAIYSSTGKCFAYVTSHVYTGSKKLAEAQWVAASRASTTTRFRFTRFTHVMENGIITADILNGIDDGLVGLHGPDRNFNVQNLVQATHLLVNALALADSTPADGFWSAVDLGWPVNTLELALYNIQQSGKRAAVRFLGVPKGYDEMFFRGQFSWAPGIEYHPLINALEALDSYTDASGTMTGARIQSFVPARLEAEIAKVEAALADATLDAEQVKKAMLASVAGFTRAIFEQTPLNDLVDILWWGAAPDWAGEDFELARRFSPIIVLLADVIAERLESGLDAAPTEGMSAQLADIATTLFALGNQGALAGRLGSAMRHRAAA